MSYGGCHGTTVITPAEASAAMAMLALKTEPSTTPMAFASDFVPLKINKDMKLDDILRETRKVYCTVCFMSTVDVLYFSVQGWTVVLL